MVLFPIEVVFCVCLSVCLSVCRQTNGLNFTHVHGTGLFAPSMKSATIVSRIRPTILQLLSSSPEYATKYPNSCVTRSMERLRGIDPQNDELFEDLLLFQLRGGFDENDQDVCGPPLLQLSSIISNEEYILLMSWDDSLIPSLQLLALRRTQQ